MILVTGLSIMPTDIAKLLPTIIRYKNLSTTLGENGNFIDLYDSPEPFFDIVLNSIEPYLVDDAGYIMSFGGMSMQFHRKNLGLLIGGFYVPTGNLYYFFLKWNHYSNMIETVQANLRLINCQF